MQKVEPTLKERGSHLFSQLLLLQRLFHVSDEEDGNWPGTGDKARDLAFCAGIRTLVDDVTEHAKALTAVPFPLSEWQPGDGPDDERWRALTEVERREVLAMVTAYENLISWSEGMIGADSGDNSKSHLAAMEFLRAERARVGRFRQELRFLERRRSPSEPAVEQLSRNTEETNDESPAETRRSRIDRPRRIMAVPPLEPGKAGNGG